MSRAQAGTKSWYHRGECPRSPEEPPIPGRLWKTRVLFRCQAHMSETVHPPETFLPKIMQNRPNRIRLWRLETQKDIGQLKNVQTPTPAASQPVENQRILEITGASDCVGISALPIRPPIPKGSLSLQFRFLLPTINTDYITNRGDSSSLGLDSRSGLSFSRRNA